MFANFKVGKTTKALANLTTPLTPQTPFAPWGVSPQAERLQLLLIAHFFVSLYSKESIQ